MVKDVALRLIADGKGACAWGPLAKALADCWGDQGAILHDAYGNLAPMGNDIVAVLADRLDSAGAPAFVDAAVKSLDANAGIGGAGGADGLDALVGALVPYLEGAGREKVLKAWNEYVKAAGHDEETENADVADVPVATLAGYLAELVEEGIASRGEIEEIAKALENDEGPQAAIARATAREYLAGA
jgi:hypothetical protein